MEQMYIINYSLNTNFNISIDLDFSHSAISAVIFFLYCSVYRYRNIIYCASRMRLFAAYFNINASRLVKFSLTSCCYVLQSHSHSICFQKLYNLFCSAAVRILLTVEQL